MPAGLRRPRRAARLHRSALPHARAYSRARADLPLCDGRHLRGDHRLGGAGIPGGPCRLPAVRAGQRERGATLAPAFASRPSDARAPRRGPRSGPLDVSRYRAHGMVDDPDSGPRDRCRDRLLVDTAGERRAPGRTWEIRLRGGALRVALAGAPARARAWLPRALS